MPKKTIFLDRDGVINKEVGYLYKIKEFEFIDGIFEACLSLINLNYQIIIISNQSGISRGYYTEDDYQKITKWMISQFKKKGVLIIDTYHCPHSPNSDCNCRKPKPGMFLNSNKKHSISFKNSWMIGDKETDIIAANKAGINKTILVRSGHEINESKSMATFIIDSVKDVKNVIID